MSRIEFYKKYYEDLTPSTLSVSKNENKILISGFENQNKNNFMQSFEKGGQTNFNPDGAIKDKIVHASGEAGGMLVGKRHSNGGIKAINKSTGQPIEMEGGEVVITRNAVSDNTKRSFNGKMMTNRQILSAINESGGGVSFANGGQVPNNVAFDCNSEYEYGGKTMCGKDLAYAMGGVLINPNFKKWFGDSKVVDKNGNPLVVYHGTSNDFKVFDKDKVGDNYLYSGEKSFFFTQKERTAKNYAELHSNKNLNGNNKGYVISSYLKIENPLYRQTNSDFYRPADRFDIDGDDLVREALENGYDGIIIKGTNNDDLYVVFEPNQIKSATDNDGQYSSTNDNITMQMGGRIQCGSCDWSWNRKDGGDDMYVCHKCGTDNSKSYAKGGAVDDDFSDIISAVQTVDVMEDGGKTQTEVKSKIDYDKLKSYLKARINALSTELNIKSVALSIDEIGIYQREIRELITRYRQLIEQERDGISLLERLKSAYSVKWGDISNKYTKADLVSINGKKTDLTEKEYLTVRTENFKSFFGDWEQAYDTNNYTDVSKVINEKTKEPLAVFHGTNVLFTNWKTYKTNNAHYFAKKREMANFFATSWNQRGDKAGVDSQVIKKLNPNKGEFIYRCFLDIKNPIDFSRFGVDKRPVKDYLNFLKINYNVGDFDFWSNIDGNLKVTQDTLVYAWQIIRAWQQFTVYVKIYTPYDGYIFYEFIPDSEKQDINDASLSFCTFDSNQVKFADAVEFNALSDDSRLKYGGLL